MALKYRHRLQIRLRHESYDLAIAPVRIVRSRDSKDIASYDLVSLGRRPTDLFAAAALFSFQGANPSVHDAIGAHLSIATGCRGARANPAIVSKRPSGVKRTKQVFCALRPRSLPNAGPDNQTTTKVIGTLGQAGCAGASPACLVAIAADRHRAPDARAVL